MQETVKLNSFSKHENRHTIQNHGVYLGEGLGKRKDPENDQHRSDSQDFNHGEESQKNYVSTYDSGYRQKGVPRRCGSAMQSTPFSSTNEQHRRIHSAKQELRRFPRKYALPEDKEHARPSVNTEWWYGSSLGGQGKGSPSNGEPGIKKGESHRYTTSLQVIAATQRPHLKATTWKF